ncbi:hypothetical protein AB0B57_22540 [Micromonospora sp. NPDC049101]|uniref:hypothetical protein n=1 Tax=Micromonospora sp. NPDC049101 TaxID=3155032 RepID=UPI003401896A
MDTNMMVRNHPELLARAFDLLDEGITDHLRDMDILVDVPDVMTVVRMHFYTGTGYEAIHSTACESDDYAAATAILSKTNIIRCEPYGFNLSGYTQMRSLFWELRTAHG